MIFPYMTSAEEFAQYWIPIIIGVLQSFFSGIVNVIVHPLVVMPILLLTVIQIFRIFVKEKEI